MYLPFGDTAISLGWIGYFIVANLSVLILRLLPPLPGAYSPAITNSFGQLENGNMHSIEFNPLEGFSATMNTSPS